MTGVLIPMTTELVIPLAVVAVIVTGLISPSTPPYSFVTTVTLLPLLITSATEGSLDAHTISSFTNEGLMPAESSTESVVTTLAGALLSSTDSALVTKLPLATNSAIPGHTVLPGCSVSIIATRINCAFVPAGIISDTLTLLLKSAE
ncbi:hypothetical protein D3C73_854610 [compost metagenome]